MYNALEKVRLLNKAKYNVDAPIVPEKKTKMRISEIDNENKLVESEVEITDLESNAIDFIRNFCEDLRFDNTKNDLEDSDGKSIEGVSIPYNMEKDIDRLCLENAIHKFCESGTSEDAFDVYYIFIEMFLGDYSKTKIMIEMLSEFEQNASTLLMKHRDHYSHSVYVFLIGLAIYNSSSKYRNDYNNFYGFDYENDKYNSAHHFLKYWGVTSLFHDIGYPFELPFEEIKSYFEKEAEKSNNNNDKFKPLPYICYKNMQDYIKIDECNIEKAKKIVNDEFQPNNIMDMLVWRINQKIATNYDDRPKVLKYDSYCSKKVIIYDDFKKYLSDVLKWKPEDPEVFGRFMDHAYFSAVILMKTLFNVLKEEECSIYYLDSLTAILLHNSIFKYIIQNQNYKNEEGKKTFDKAKHTMKMEYFPLAYLLMLCDELQCWDRTSYGQNSRMEIHAIDCELKFLDNKIIAKYIFDSSMKVKIDIVDQSINKGEKNKIGGTYYKMATIDGGKTKFLKDIEDIVEINSSNSIQLNIEKDIRKNNRYKKKYLSESNFLHLYDFAVYLSGKKYFDLENIEEVIKKYSSIEEKFDKKSIEYKMIDISRVKEFAKYLDAINCFYTDRPVVYPLMNEFNDEEMNKIGPLEHKRWIEIHKELGWIYGDKYVEIESNNKKEKNSLRELFRTHKLMIESGDYSKESIFEHYNKLPDSEKDKDTKPMNDLLKILAMFDGVRFYRNL